MFHHVRIDASGQEETTMSATNHIGHDQIGYTKHHIGHKQCRYRPHVDIGHTISATKRGLRLTVVVECIEVG